MSAAPGPSEAIGHAGFDFVVVDMEHVPVDVPQLTDILRAVGCTPAVPVVRMAWNDLVITKRVLDAGAATIMVPFVQTADEARAAVAAAKYPPLGHRGVAAIQRGSRYGAAPDYLKRANDETFVIVQLETPEAVERLTDIASVPGVDALFIGPGDLSAAMGHIGDLGHPEVQALIQSAADQADRLGKPIGIVGPNPQMVSAFLDYGYSFSAMASDIAMMTGRARDWLADLRGDGNAATSTVTSAY
ncbi:aldolase/citrate lyase family protein [Jiella sp. MQZ9-1]|nr:aldolase/citrate lyase family protein [Jiella flava]MCD2471547.1 aldolase/citrate lyase family protein [Jiella flava]